MDLEYIEGSLPPAPVKCPSRIFLMIWAKPVIKCKSL